MVMGREIRRVPAGWQHPTEVKQQLIVGRRYGDLRDFQAAFANPQYEMREAYKPLYDRSYDEARREWHEGKALWNAGTHPDQQRDDPPDCTWEEWDGEAPDPDRYRPHWAPEDATHYQMYETVSEGTPVSPVFATLDELAVWLVGQGYSPQASREFCRTGWAPSMVMAPGMGLKDGITAGGIFAAKEREHSDED
jgi:hypothetical protein